MDKDLTRFYCVSEYLFAELAITRMQNGGLERLMEHMQGLAVDACALADMFVSVREKYLAERVINQIVSDIPASSLPEEETLLCSEDEAPLPVSEEQPV